MNITTYTMILIAKMSALSFCYKDGAEKEENLFPEQKALKVVEMPSLIQFLSYVFYSGGCLMGPFFEYSDYIKFIERTGHYAEMPLNTIIPSIVRLFHGLCKVLLINLYCSMFRYLYFCRSIRVGCILRDTGVCRDEVHLQGCILLLSYVKSETPILLSLGYH